MAELVNLLANYYQHLQRSSFITKNGDVLLQKLILKSIEPFLLKKRKFAETERRTKEEKGETLQGNSNRTVLERTLALEQSIVGEWSETNIRRACAVLMH